MALVSVYCVFGSADEAERIGRTVIGERLAACVNILAPCRSIYRWNGAVETAEEVPAVFKTTAQACERLIARLAELHSYEVPAITVWPVEQALPAYERWVAETKGNILPVENSPQLLDFLPLPRN